MSLPLPPLNSAGWCPCVAPSSPGGGHRGGGEGEEISLQSPCAPHPFLATAPIPPLILNVGPPSPTGGGSRVGAVPPPRPFLLCAFLHPLLQDLSSGRCCPRLPHPPPLRGGGEETTAVSPSHAGTTPKLWDPPTCTTTMQSWLCSGGGGAAPGGEGGSGLCVSKSPSRVWDAAGGFPMLLDGVGGLIQPSFAPPPPTPHPHTMRARRKMWG